MKTYARYKDSGISWIGDVPEHWNIRYLFQKAGKHYISNKNVHHQNLLSLSYGRIIQKDINKTEGLLPESFDTYQIVENGNIILRLTDLQNDHKSLRVGLVTQEGIITSAYECLEVIDYSLFPEYLYYQLHSFDIKKMFYGMGGGLRQNLNYNELKKIRIAIPPLSEQKAIAEYLDKKTAQINELVSAKQKQIELLKEYKQSVIANAVTGKLDERREKRKWKDSGISWIGKIPENWEIKRAKYMFKKEKREVRDSDDVVTCFRDGEVTLRKNRRTSGFTESITEIGYQGIRKNDLVIHQMDAFAGAIGVSDSDGKGTSVYHCCTPLGDYDVRYYASLLRIMAKKGFIQSLYRGIRERSSDFNFQVFGKQYLVVPPLSEQKEIVAYIEKKVSSIDSQITSIENQIANLNEYKQSLISDVVTGKVKVC
ncbi:restriction endonuclease subunit S [Fibrobacter sp.]|uniref:restriction endonuclease subunit S n=1 Tax=Fibrobacter sp. TaxID=35828 RepID=UPI0025C32EB9|nr:restriction endonuclease subunit S [Fibrobacter sp.]MBR4006261.1 restriction endonuclease subunit S [Fibrobacter sp.]